MRSPEEVSRLLAECSNGDQAAFNELLPLVYDELHSLAANYMSRERPGHTLQTTALVHEAYLRLAGQRAARWQDQVHFFAVAATVMRHILIDHARSRSSAKRAGDQVRLPLEEAVLLSGERMADLLALHEALNRLAEFDLRKCQVVEMRYFGGMTNEEVAERLNVHPNTVMRDWELAKSWLYLEMSKTVTNDDR
jgi:RNA polymerase sigma factor (TIGR02999 family)